MQIAALGSTVGLRLRLSSRERRILMLAGVAAGMAALFRTPLGAALLAAEVISATTSKPRRWCPPFWPASSRIRSSASRGGRGGRGERRAW